MEGMNPIAAIVQPSALKPPVFVGLASALCALSGSIIALRLWTNFNHIQKLHVDDLLNSNPNDVTIEHLTRLVAVGIASGNSAVYSAKLPLLFMLIRIFGIKDWLRWTCIFLIVVGTLGGVITLLYAGISCSPDLHEPTPPFLFSCVGALTNATIARGSISLAVDVIVFVVPIPVIVDLKMPLRRKIGVAFVFATGLLAIAASALGLYFQKAQSTQSSTNFANALLVTVIESAVVLMVSCTPAIHIFWTKHAGFLRRRFGLLTSSHTKSKLSESKTNLGGSSTSNSDRPQVRAHDYVELQEVADMGKSPYDPKVLNVKQYV
ncbi:hypothetical protein N7530_011975 [Penicillium desertorum]|uniref:Rhodopsin domain-containing protein n=1 Tax=Penicillium desertorum TaxID=1303715 RepID=A0A9X0BG45_9EURO|nr:hypothetical protein N7530_011975 [Penicillium desertorum]